MALARSAFTGWVQAASGNAVTGNLVVPAGAVVFAAVAHGTTTTATTFTVSDSSGMTWNLIAEIDKGDTAAIAAGAAAVYWAHASSARTITVSASASASGPRAVAAMAVTGADTLDPVGTVNTGYVETTSVSFAMSSTVSGSRMYAVSTDYWESGFTQSGATEIISQLKVTGETAYGLLGRTSDSTGVGQANPLTWTNANWGAFVIVGFEVLPLSGTKHTVAGTVAEQLLVTGDPALLSVIPPLPVDGGVVELNVVLPAPAVRVRLETTGRVDPVLTVVLMGAGGTHAVAGVVPVVVAPYGDPRGIVKLQVSGVVHAHGVPVGFPYAISKGPVSGTVYVHARPQGGLLRLILGGGGLQLPDGVLAYPTPVTSDLFFGAGRVTDYRFDVLDSDENLVGALGTVVGGSVDWVSRTAVHGGGSVDVVDLGANDIDWLNVRVRPVVLTAAEDYPDRWVEHPVGVFLPAAPVEQWTALGRSWSVELLDKLSILDQDIPTDSAGNPVTFTAVQGANVVETVRGLIEGTGEGTPAVGPDSKTLPRALVWDAGTTRLKIINDLLAAASFRSLWADGSGQFRVTPWAPAQERPPVYELLGPFIMGASSLMAPEWTRDRDIYEVPNRYVAITSGSGTEAALTAVATNTDPASKFSYPSRGRWITRVLTNAEATSQADLDSIALRGLTATTSVTSVVSVKHPFLPDLVMDATVRLVNPDAGINGLAVVNKTSVVFDPTGLCDTELLEVATLTAEGSEL